MSNGALLRDSLSVQITNDNGDFAEVSKESESGAVVLDKSGIIWEIIENCF